ncbi:MAG: cupin domain-containing protein [Actinomycetota bacterium]|nr:cupin domain-containing protein [Actinomycetota bacterium]
MTTPSEVTDSGADLALGSRIRGLRRVRGATLKSVALEAGVSESFLSQVERGQANPSVATLRRIASALGRSVSELFDGEDGEGFVVRQHQRRRIAMPGGEWIDYVLTPSIARKLQIHETVIRPGGSSGVEPYSHGSEEECVIVLSGQVEVTLEGQKVVLEEGDTALLDARREHQFRNTTQEVVRVLWVMTPANSY